MVESIAATGPDIGVGTLLGTLHEMCDSLGVRLEWVDVIGGAEGGPTLQVRFIDRAEVKRDVSWSVTIHVKAHKEWRIFSADCATLRQAYHRLHGDVTVWLANIAAVRGQA